MTTRDNRASLEKKLHNLEILNRELVEENNRLREILVANGISFSPQHVRRSPMKHSPSPNQVRSSPRNMKVIPSPRNSPAVFSNGVIASPKSPVKSPTYSSPSRIIRSTTLSPEPRRSTPRVLEFNDIVVNSPGKSARSDLVNDYETSDDDEIQDQIERIEGGARRAGVTEYEVESARRKFWQQKLIDKVRFPFYVTADKHKFKIIGFSSKFLSIEGSKLQFSALIESDVGMPETLDIDFELLDFETKPRGYKWMVMYPWLY